MGNLPHNFIDLTGKTFGRLSVVGRAKDRVSKAGNRSIMWACMCSCGGPNSIKAVSSDSLRMGTTTSCGCFFYDSHVKDLTGQRFGRLTVLRQEGRNNHRHLKWACRCDCGTEKAIVGTSMVRGLVVSCGCYHREQASTTEFEDLTNHTFGKLTVLEQAPSRVAHDKRGDYKKRVWLCACECGAIVEVPENSLKTGHTNSCGCYRLECAVAALSGEKSPNWKGGVTSIQDRVRASCLYAQWRGDVFARDEYTCQVSKQRGVELHAHHIKPFAKVLEDNNIQTWVEAQNCAELWDINNGITLAAKYHAKEYADSFHTRYGTRASEEDFHRWFGEMTQKFGAVSVGASNG